MIGPLFADRREAGRALGRRLRDVAAEPIVIALPRGGVPVGFEVAAALHAPLDIALVGKLGAPGEPELGIGALGEDGAIIVDRDAVDELRVSRSQLEKQIERGQTELARRSALYRGDRPALSVAGATVILVDDGVATGVSAIAAGRTLRARGAAAIILGVPVCPQETYDRLAGEFDRFISLHRLEGFGGVGAWYDDFSQTTDREVIDLLAYAAAASS